MGFSPRETGDMALREFFAAHKGWLAAHGGGGSNGRDLPEQEAEDMARRLGIIGMDGHGN